MVSKAGIDCPRCGASSISARTPRPLGKQSVVDSRTLPDNSIWRRRRCGSCGKRFTTRERIYLPQVKIESSPDWQEVE